MTELVNNLNEAAPAIASEMVEFKFKAIAVKDDDGNFTYVKDAEGNFVLDKKGAKQKVFIPSREPVSLPITYQTIDDVLPLCVPGSKALKLLNDLLAEVAYERARELLETTDAQGNLVYTNAANFPFAQLDFVAIAEQEREDKRKGGGIDSSIWEGFYLDYAKVMLPIIATKRAITIEVAAKRVETHVAHLKNRLNAYKRDQIGAGYFITCLTDYLENSEDASQYAGPVDALLTKLTKWLEIKSVSDNI